MTPTQARFIRALLDVLKELEIDAAPPQATKAFLSTTGVAMSAATVNVDTVNAKATVQFVDDHGDTDAVAPDGTVATFASDNPDVLTVAADPDNAYAADLTPVHDGVANISVTLADAAGNPLLEADGVTAWAPVDPCAVTVTVGNAVGAQLSVQ